MNEDGSEREELKTLYAYEAGDASCSLDFVIHRGYGYMVTNWVQNDREEKEQTLYRISLNSSDKKEELAKIKGYTPMIYIVEGVGNHIYFKTSRYTDQDGQNLEIVNYELNIMTDKVQKIDLPSGLSIIAAKNNQYICLEQDGTGIITYNKTEKKAKTLFKWDYDNTLVYHDEKYLYLDNEVYLILHDKPDADRRIVVIDYNGNKLCEWKKFGETMLKFFWSDSERLLLQNTEDGTFQLLKLTDVSRFE
jgi:hypothetical protein